MQGHLDDAPCLVVAHLTVGLDESEITRCGAAGPHHKLADAPVGLIFAAWALGREALIVVVVADENDIRTVVIERLIQIDGGAALVAARTEGRPVVVGQRTGSPISVQVGAQPLFLFRTGLVRKLAVQGNDVPLPEVV